MSSLTGKTSAHLTLLLLEETISLSEPSSETNIWLGAVRLLVSSFSIHTEEPYKIVDICRYSRYPHREQLHELRQTLPSFELDNDISLPV